MKSCVNIVVFAFCQDSDLFLKINVLQATIFIVVHSLHIFLHSGVLAKAVGNRKRATQIGSAGLFLACGPYVASLWSSPFA